MSATPLPTDGIESLLATTAKSLGLQVSAGDGAQVILAKIAAAAQNAGTVATTPSGAAGGDLSGSYPNPTVVKVAGVTPTAAGLNLLDDASAAAQRTTLGVGTGDSPTFAGATIGGVGVNVATTAATLYVDSLGSDSTGARGNKDKPFLTAQAAHNAASPGDIIRLPKGNHAISGVLKEIHYRGVYLLTNLTLTFTTDGSDPLGNSTFEGFYTVDMAVTPSGNCILAGASISNAVFSLNVIGDTQLDLGGAEIGIQGIGAFNLSHEGAAATTIGSATFKGGYGSYASLFGCAADVEIYFINSAHAEGYLYSDAGSTSTGALNAQGCYDADLHATTVSIKNTVYTTLVYTTLVDGGGNRSSTLDISNAVVSTTASGTAYALTNSYAALDFGTTDPVITLPQGTWLLYANIQTKYNATTFAGLQTESFKLRRTNNTAADVDTERSAPLAIVTALTENGPAITLGPVPYTSANANDSLTIFGTVSATPGAGSMQVVNAVITAIKL